MTALFLNIVNMSIAAGWIVLAAVLIRRLFKKAPRWALCLLWVIVAIRLVVPSLPQSSWSIIPSSRTIISHVSMQEETASQGKDAAETDVRQDPLVEIRSGISTLNTIADRYFIGEDAFGQPDPVRKEIILPAEQQQIAETRQAAAVKAIDIAAYVWAAGFAAMLVYMLVSYIRLHKRVAASVPAGNGAMVCDDIDTPFVLGALRPRIYLPSGLSETAKTHILAHEQAHIARRDHLWKPVGFLVLAVHWFNPLVWLAYVLFCFDMELACDEKVAGALTDPEKAMYSQTLLDSRRPAKLVAACPLAFAGTGIRQRVKSVLSYKKPALWLIIAALLACFVLAACTLTDKTNAAGGGNNVINTDPDPSGMRMTITVNDKTYYQVAQSTAYRPYGYVPMGKVQIDNASGSRDVYMAAGLDDVYVLDVQGKFMRFSPDPNALPEPTFEDVLALSKKKDITWEDFKPYVVFSGQPSAGHALYLRVNVMYQLFVRFDAAGRADKLRLARYDYAEAIDVLTEDVQAFIDAHYVVDIIDTAETHDTAIETFWRSGGLEYRFPVIKSGTMYVVMADGSRIPLKSALEERIILVTDIPRFGHKVYIGGLYEGELTGLTPDAARLAQLKAHVPQFFGVDSSKGLTIYVYSLAAQHYSCGILPGDAQGVDLFGSSQSGSLTRDDVLLILKSEYPDVPDSKITVRPYTNPISSYLVIDKEAYANQLKALFGGRFKVGSSIGFMVKDPDNTAQVGVPEAQPKQGQLSVWFDALDPADKMTISSETFSLVKNKWVTVQDLPGMSFMYDGSGILMKTGEVNEYLIQNEGLIINAFFCDLSGDGKPELCITLESGSGIIDRRVKIFDIANGAKYELSDRGNFDYTWTERNGSLIVMKRAYEKTSSVGSDMLVTIRDGSLYFGPDI